MMHDNSDPKIPDNPYDMHGGVSGLENSRYLELIKRQRKLQQEIDFAKRTEAKRIIEYIVDMMRAFDIQIDDIEMRLSRAYGRKTIAPKYMNPKTGQTWSGRGRQPLWMKGRNAEDFRIK
ncbi:TPA: H-NS histone family protein [Burkholderia vietnamiensis]|nr:H-NS histone family protein [Burkholderia vietnamiensis]MBR8001282.1 H-NS histone family protein [Burkholderia vietnamiensis]MBR8055861.1 H-NS histone family protein [Burkholderia vietnamiensis]MBR8231870.1 H-NS histone family protein [Burkholderia vietnamiensis]MCA7946503.1 H-NS histone family protein [Burkholderia vietnamiensis]MCA8211116.1 H-NS histone family protein [Burkholderia vietnamiensis]